MNRQRTWNPSRFLIGLACAAAIAAAITTPASAAGPSDEEVAKMAEASPEKATVKPAKARKLLIFNRCEGFRHSAIPYGAAALKVMGDKTGAYESVISDDMAMFEPETLKQFDAVVFNNTVSLKFEKPEHRKALIDFISGGGGMIGIHGGADNFKNWPEAAAMMGGVFTGHPWQECPVKIDDPKHPLVRVFEGKGFWVTDEIYKFGGPYSRDKLRVLLSMDDAKGDPNHQGRKDNDDAVAWIQQVGKGRVFFCSLGHRHEIFWNPTLLAFYLDGVQYALGDLKADATPSAELNPQPKAAMPPEK
ncbi:MAG: ThuA domain-containing protein [Planctomycetes bacterium]|nr:ThuA domain-containing protein [Planctomycetota bacterium]